MPAAADLAEPAQHGRGPGPGGHVVARRGHVAGVEAVAHAVRLLGILTDQGQLLEAVAEVRAGSRRRLQAGDHPVAGQVAVHPVQGLDHPLQARQFVAGGGAAGLTRLLRRARSPQVRAGMHDTQRNPECFAALEFGSLRRQRLGPHVAVPRGEVDQVAAVADRAARTTAAMPPDLLQTLPPGGQFVLTERPRGPLPLVSRENLHAVEAQAPSLRQGVDEPPRDGQVRAEHGLIVRRRARGVTTRMPCGRRTTDNVFARRRMPPRHAARRGLADDQRYTHDGGGAGC